MNLDRLKVRVVEEVTSLGMDRFAATITAQVYVDSVEQAIAISYARLVGHFITKGLGRERAEAEAERVIVTRVLEIVRHETKPNVGIVGLA